MDRMINVNIIYLLVGSALIVSANECRVREKYSPELWNGNPLKILAFTSDQDGFTCMLNFQRLDNYLFYDQIVLSNTGNKVIRTDHGNIEYLDINSTLNATGWNEFTFSIDDNSNFMATVRDELVLNYKVEYPVKTITTYGSNISLCSSPSWAVGENEVIVIPLYTRLQDNDRDAFLNPNNSSIYLTLSSTASFRPIIKVDGIKRFLTMKDGEILLSQDFFQPLRLKKYLLEVHTQKQKVNINCKLGNNSIKLMEFQVATVLSDIEISSQGMSFTVDLDINSILFTTTTSTTTAPATITITSTTPSVLVVATNDGTSTGLVVGIVITILALLAALVIFIIFYKRYKISSMKTLSSGFHEETQQHNGSYRNNKSEMEKFIDDKNVISSHEQRQNYDGNYRSSIPEMVTLIGSKDETRLQEENHSNDGNCSKSANDLETLSENGEKARSQEVRQTVAKNYKIDTNDVEKSFERTEDKRSQDLHQENTVNGIINTFDVENSLQKTEETRSQEVHQEITLNDIINTKDVEKSLQKTEETSDDMDGLEIPSERQSDLKDTKKGDYLREFNEKESGAVLLNEVQSTIGSSPGNNILRGNPPPRADLLQGPLPRGNQPPHIAHSTLQSAAVHTHTYKSIDNGEHINDAPPELSQEEIDKRINLNNSLYSSAIDRSKTHIASGEYANAREVLSNAIILINQSKVAKDSRHKTIIEILQKKLDEIKSKIDNIFNLNGAQLQQFPTSNEHPNAGNSDQLLLYESPSSSYHLQFPQNNPSAHKIAVPSNDSQSAAVFNQQWQDDYQQQDLRSTGKRASTRRSNKQQHYVTTAMRFKDEMDQTQVKHEDIVKHLK